MREQVAWAGLIATAGAFSNCASGQRGSGRVDPPALLHLLHLDHGLLFSGLSPHLICPSHPICLPLPSLHCYTSLPFFKRPLTLATLTTQPPSLLLIPAFGFLWFGHLRTCENQAGSLILYTPIPMPILARKQIDNIYLILLRDAIKMKTWENSHISPFFHFDSVP